MLEEKEKLKVMKDPLDCKEIVTRRNEEKEYKESQKSTEEKARGKAKKHQEKTKKQLRRHQQEEVLYPSNICC